MSDNFLLIVPRDPRHIPLESTQLLVAEVLHRLAPSATSITRTETVAVRFFDCGGNFERVCCPHCATALAIDWWQARMDADFDGEGFCLGNLVTPCCGRPSRLNELTYNWPQAFGRFSWSIQNPNIGELDENLKDELERIAGVPLAVIFQRL